LIIAKFSKSGDFKSMRLKNFVLFAIILSSTVVYSQKTDIFSVGVFTGTSFYNGDFNPDIPFKNPGIAAGALMRIHFNSRHILKTSFNYGQLSGQAGDEFVPTSIPNFQANVYELNTQFEFNFLPYNDILNEQKNFTPYISGGIGISFIPTQALYTPCVPVAVGVKYTLKRRLTIGLEYSYRLTFSDRIDNIYNGYDNDPQFINTSLQNKSVFHNNDLYAFAGLFVTWRIYNRGFVCPAYR